MTYVITEPCIGVKDGSWADVCPERPLLRIVELNSTVRGGLHDRMEHSVYLVGISVPDAAVREASRLNQRELEMRQRIETLVESVRDDQTRSQQLFHYVWTMI